MIINVKAPIRLSQVKLFWNEINEYWYDEYWYAHVYPTDEKSGRETATHDTSHIWHSFCDWYLCFCGRNFTGDVLKPVFFRIYWYYSIEVFFNELILKLCVSLKFC